jgi:hypothetical protein
MTEEKHEKNTAALVSKMLLHSLKKEEKQISKYLKRLQQFIFVLKLKNLK